MAPLKLPSTVISQPDIGRLIRELNALEDFFVGAKARTTGTAISLPKISGSMERLAADNQINLLMDDERQRLAEGLKTVFEKAPSMHISFAVEPSPKALEQILLWMRQNIHPQALLSVGLQPAIAAGCVLRTTNKVFDLSLRSNLQRQSTYLVKLIQGAVDGR